MDKGFVSSRSPIWHFGLGGVCYLRETCVHTHSLLKRHYLGFHSPLQQRHQPATLPSYLCLIWYLILFFINGHMCLAIRKSLCRRFSLKRRNYSPVTSMETWCESVRNLTISRKVVASLGQLILSASILEWNSRCCTSRTRKTTLKTKETKKENRMMLKWTAFAIVNNGLQSYNRRQIRVFVVSALHLFSEHTKSGKTYLQNSIRYLSSYNFFLWITQENATHIWRSLIKWTIWWVKKV